MSQWDREIERKRKKSFGATEVGNVIYKVLLFIMIIKIA